MGNITVIQHLHFDVGLESVDQRIAQAAPKVAEATRISIFQELARPTHT
jgi:hypothetical protein